MSVERIRVTLTSDGSGDATANSVSSFTGKVIAIAVINSGDAQPSASWDLTVRNNNLSSGTTAVPNLILVDAAVDQLVTRAQWYMPTEFGVVPTTGVPRIEAGNIPLMCDGVLNFIGANMGASKIAYVNVYIETF